MKKNIVDKIPKETERVKSSGIFVSILLFLFFAFICVGNAKGDKESLLNSFVFNKS